MHDEKRKTNQKNEIRRHEGAAATWPRAAEGPSRRVRRGRDATKGGSVPAALWPRPDGGAAATWPRAGEGPRPGECAVAGAR